MNAHSGQRQFKVERAGDRRPFKPKVKRWSHQDELVAAKGQKVILSFGHPAEEDFILGVLLEADQFTVKVQHKDSDHVEIYFKHDIRSIKVG